MSMSDPLGDLATRIRNGQSAGRQTIKAPASQFRQSVLDVLVREGYLEGYEVSEVRRGVKEFDIRLKSFGGVPVIRKIQRVSKPGRRVYSGVQDLPRQYDGLGISVLSTPRGVLSDAEARRENVGGEVLLRLF